MINDEKARELAQAWVGLKSEVTLLDAPPDGLYLASPEEHFYFTVTRPRVERVGGDEIAIVNRLTGEVRTTFAGE